MSIKFSTLIFFVSILLTNRLHAEFPPALYLTTDTSKTVAIYSSKKSLFPDYPLDTLVAHLNATNSNPGIKYYKNSEDRSKTGFYADYVVDIDFWVKQSQLAAPQWKKVESKGSAKIKLADGTYSSRNVIETKEIYVEATTKPAEAEVRIKIIEKRKNEKVTKQTFSAVNNREQDIKRILIINLITYLHQQFSK